jgi:cell fate (sporulation/competence/biofilm development) regulator YlbF (YheA/YmcA/DUF963 family)
MDLTYQVIDEIKASKDYQRLLELHQIIKNDPAISQLVGQFNNYKEKYQEVQKYGKYHPDLKEVQIGFSEAKTSLYNHVLILEYKQLEKKIQSLLDRISTEIAEAISPKIKHPNDIGLINKK